MNKSLKNIIFLEIFIPIVLLILGITHGFLQVLYRAGIIKSFSILGVDYYQGLTLHGVVNAIVFTTFFAVAFGNGLITFYLKKIPNLLGLWISFWAMLIGTLLAAYTILIGKASVLYTFYPPLKAHPLFYIGATLLVVGSWISFFTWIPLYLNWRKENLQKKTPMAVLGIFSTFIVWFIATIPLAYEVLFMLIPWSLGIVPTINVMLARTLFWFFGHPLVYFWLLPAYVMFYSMLPKVAGGKLFSDFAGRIVFFSFIVLSAPVGLHHQFADPAISTSWKWLQTILTFAIVVPSFITFFTLTASLEYAGRSRGGKGLLGWWKCLPYFSTENWLFSYLISGLMLFIFGGITGLINASYSMNTMIHNTSWVPGHFHTTVGGPVFLSFIGMSLYMMASLCGRQIQSKKINTVVPYLWVVGVLIFSMGMSIAGMHGEPRRTNLGLSYADPASPLYHKDWAFYSKMTVVGGTLMFSSMCLYFWVFFRTLFSARVKESTLTFPVAEAYHDENVACVKNFKPWIICAVLLLIIAYGPPLYDIVSTTISGSPPFIPQSPVSWP